MFRLIPKIFIFIIFAANALAVLQLSVRVTYDPDSVAVEAGSLSRTEKYNANKFLHPPQNVLVYFLDLADPKVLANGQATVEQYLRKTTWSRPSHEVDAEFQKDKKKNDEFIEKKIAWKNGKKEGPQPTAPVYTKDGPITATLDVTFLQLGDKDVDDLKIKILENSFEQVVIIIYKSDPLELVGVNRSSDFQVAHLFLRHQRQPISTPLKIAFFHSLNSQSVVFDHQAKKSLFATPWVSLSRDTGIFFFLSDRPSHDVPQKVYVEGGVMRVDVYKDEVNTRVLARPKQGGLALLTEHFPEVFACNVDLPLLRGHKTLRVFFRYGDSPLELISETSVTQSLELTEQSKEVAAYFQRITKVRSISENLRVAKESLDVEVQLMGQERDVLVLKAKELGDDFRVTFFTARSGYMSLKSTYFFRKAAGKPLRLFWFHPNQKKAYQLQFDRTVPLDLNLLKRSHFIEFVEASVLFTKETLTSASQFDPDEPAPTDFATVTNFDSLGLSSENRRAFVYHSGHTSSGFLYKREEGFFVQVKRDQLILSEFIERDGSNYADLSVRLPSALYDLRVEIVGVGIDVENNFKEFPHEAVPVIEGELYFLKMPTAFQVQLTNLKVSVCRVAGQKLTLCFLSLYKSFEADISPGKMVYYEGGISSTVQIPRPYATVQPLILQPDACIVPKVLKLEAYKPSGFDKVFIYRYEMQFMDRERTEVFCPETSNTCYVLFVDARRHGLTAEERSTLKVDLTANTCAFEKLPDVILDIEKSQLKIKTFDSSRVVTLALPPKFRHTPQLKQFSWNGNRMVLHCQYFGDKNNGPCDYSNNYAYNFLRTELERDFLRPLRHPLDLPFVLFDIQGPLLEFRTFHTPGTIRLSLTLDSFEIAHDETLMGSAVFERVRIYQRRTGYIRATIKLFLVGLEPVVIPVSFQSFVDFKEALAQGTPLEVTADIQGNVHPEHVWALYNRVSNTAYSLYGIENGQGEMELLIYPSDTVGVFEVVDTNVRGELDDLLPFLAPDKRASNENVPLAINFAAASGKPQYFNNREDVFYLVKTGFKGVEVMLARKNLLASLNPKFRRMVDKFYDATMVARVSSFVKHVDGEFEDDSSHRLVI